MADYIEGRNFRAEFEGFTKDVAEAKAVLQANLEKAVALGDEALAASIRGTMSKLESSGLSTEGVKGVVKELKEEQVVLEQNLKTSAEILDVQRQQAREQLTRVEIEKRLAAAQARAAAPRNLVTQQFYSPTAEERLAAAAQRRESGGLIIPPSYASGATAGQQLAAEEAQRVKNAEILVRLQEEEAAAQRKMVAGWEANAKAQQEAKVQAAQEKAEIDLQNGALLRQEKIRDALNARLKEAEALGAEAAAAGSALPASQRTRLTRPPAGIPANAFSADDKALIRERTLMGEYNQLQGRTELGNNALGASFIRLGLQENESSNALRRHGALTTEYLQALARGETTVREFGYQIGATIGKFAGWTAAAAATYGALGAVAEFGKGAIDASTGAERLRRTIEGVDPHQATLAIQSLSQGTNVSIAEASDAIFRFSRTFHDLPNATAAAKLGLAAFKLDQVSMADSVKASTAIITQFGGGAARLRSVYDELAAGQRIWNARISEMIPLLQKSTGAVKNAGGELDPLVQLGVYFQRITQLSGSQIGTAFYRSAATFLSPNTTKGQNDRAVLEGLGINTNQGWTKIVHDALLKSLTLSESERAKVSNAIFGPQYGGRVAAGFNPQGIPTYEQITKSITPQGTQGSLQRELNTELQTTRERMKSFVNEMQRMGAAIGDSGLLSGVNVLISGLVKVGKEFRNVAEGFAGLPAPAKDTVVALEAIGAALLFLNKTRFGNSLADLTGLSKIPGLGGGDATRARTDLRVGTRAAQEVVEGQIAQSSTRLLTLEGRQNQLAAERERILAGRTRFEELSLAEAQQIRDLDLKIAAIGNEQTVIDRERIAQLDVQANLANTQTLLRRSPRRGGYTDDEVLALQGNVQKGTQAAEKSLEETRGLFSKVTTGIGGFVGGLRDMALSIDPLLAAMIAFPIALGAIDSAINKLKDANQAAADALKAPVSSSSDVQTQADAFAAKAKKLRDTQVHGSAIPGEDDVLNYFTGVFGLSASPEQVAKASGQSQGLRTIADSYKHIAKLFQSDAQDLSSSTQGRAELYRVSRLMKQHFGAALRGSGLPLKDINKIYEAFTVTLQNEYNASIQTGVKAHPGNIDLLLRETDKQLKSDVQAFSDRAEVYGLTKNDLTRAAGAYLVLAARYRNSSDQKGLQAVKQAQGAYLAAINKNVTDFTEAAQGSTTYGGAVSGYGSALGAASRGKATMDRITAELEKKFKGFPGIVRYLQDAARQIDAQLNDKLKSTIESQIQVIEQNASLRAAQISGISPEADIARAEATLAGLQQAYAKAKAEHASWDILAGLLTQIDTSMQDIAKQKIQNADALAQARGALYVSQVTGTGPQADIERARRGITVAQQTLARDRSEGKGQAAILQDQATLNDAVRAFNQQLQQRAQQLDQNLAAFIQSEAALAESQTTDPTKKAQLELGAAIRTLATIKPGDYQTNQEYLTALNNQRAKINDARTALNEQIVQTDLRNLQFEHDVHKIGDQQYINGLRNILRNKKLTTEERQQILTEIYNLSHQGSTLDLNVGNIKLPSIYEIRRAIGLGKSGIVPAGAQNTTINHSSTVNVYVNGKGDAWAVGKVIDEHLGTSVRSAMRARGVIG